MILSDFFRTGQRREISQSPWHYLHLDLPLLTLLLLLAGAGLLVLYSASGQSASMVSRQALHLAVGFGILFLFAQVHPDTYRRWAPFVYAGGVILLVAVLFLGHRGKGASRWLNLVFFRFQPSEILKLAIPLFLAWYCHRVQLPLSGRHLLAAALFIFIPVLLTAKQPDLGTAILQLSAGGSVLLLAGISWSLLLGLGGLAAVTSPFIWFLLHGYQKNRILVFLNPERDPLGAGYHIIQSKIAIGSGGLFGKGWLQGTQSHLHFLPEHATDFIFAVCGEEAGFAGSMILIVFFMLVTVRGIQIALHAQDSFSRLLAGSITVTFFVSFFTNTGMVTGILPVVGLPLPLVSYGGSSMITLMAGFGILMSVRTHRKLLTG